MISEALTLQEENRFDEALTELDRALRSPGADRSTRGIVLTLIGLNESYQGAHHAAINYYTAALDHLTSERQDSHVVATLFARCVSYAETGDPDSAMADYRERSIFQESADGDPTLARWVASAYLRSGRHDSARPLLEYAVGAGDGSTAARAGADLAEILFSADGAKDYSRMRALLERAVDGLDGAHRERARINLGLVLEQLGEVDEARELWTGVAQSAFERESRAAGAQLRRTERQLVR